MSEERRDGADQLIASHDWSRTPLGPIAAWPSCLRTAVDLIVASPLPMAILWGDDLVHIPNAAFAALSAGGAAPAIGRSARTTGGAGGLIDLPSCARAVAGEALTTEHRLSGAAVTLAYSPVRQEGGRAGGVLVVATVRPAADEQARLMGEAHLRLAMAASSAGAWTWDARTNEATWDDCYHAMYGVGRDEPPTHEAWLNRLHPDDRLRVQARIDTVAQTPGDDEWDIEFRAIVPGRGVVWMQGLGRAMRTPDGAVSSMAGINLDITARKQIEQQLRTSEEHLRLFFEYAPIAKAMFDRDMRYIAVSRRWRVDFGLAGELIGRRHYDVSPEIPEHWRAVHRRCLQGAVEHADEERFERPNGVVQWLRWEVRPWRNAAGEIGGIIVFSEDVTAARRARERQQVLVSELQHRTRNLIAMVESIAQQTMRTTDSAAAFMARFSVRLRALSRVQGLLSRSEDEPITIGTLVRMELEALAPEPAGARTVVSGPDIALRKRDVQTLALAIHELATNACKYGALATDRGRLAVIWDLERDGDGQPQLSLEWTESDIAPSADATPSRLGYGRTLIERALPYSLSAHTSFELSARAFRCTIRLAVDGDSAGGPPATDSSLPPAASGGA